MVFGSPPGGSNLLEKYHHPFPRSGEIICYSGTNPAKVIDT